MKRFHYQNARGFLLLEVVLALGIFAMACTGLTMAFQRMAHTASLAQSEMRLTRILDSALTEQLSLPSVEEGEKTIFVEDSDLELLLEVSPLDEMENRKGEILQQMFLIKVTAKWLEGNTWQTREAETWRYAPMYKP